jgi:hypothetical protein
MNTNNQVMFPNYNPELSHDRSRLSQVKVIEQKHELVEKI